MEIGNLNFSRPFGSRKDNEPKAMREVLKDYAQSNEPFAMCFRTTLASEEKQAEKGDMA